MLGRHIQSHTDGPGCMSLDCGRKKRERRRKRRREKEEEEKERKRERRGERKGVEKKDRKTTTPQMVYM